MEKEKAPIDQPSILSATKVSVKDLKVDSIQPLFQKNIEEPIAVKVVEKNEIIKDKVDEKFRAISPKSFNKLPKCTHNPLKQMRLGLNSDKELKVEDQTLNSILPFHQNVIIKPKTSHGMRQRRDIRSNQEQIFAQRAMSNAYNPTSVGQNDQNIFEFLNLYSTASRPISSQFSGKRHLASNSNYTSNIFNKYLQQPTATTVSQTTTNAQQNQTQTMQMVRSKSKPVQSRRFKRPNGDISSKLDQILKGERLETNKTPEPIDTAEGK